jgi:hypothetical protein
MPLAERQGGGEGEEFVVIGGTSRDTGLVSPAGAEETGQGGGTAKTQQVGRIAGRMLRVLVGHGGLLSRGVIGFYGYYTP